MPWWRMGQYAIMSRWGSPKYNHDAAEHHISFSMSRWSAETSQIPFFLHEQWSEKLHHCNYWKLVLQLHDLPCHDLANKTHGINQQTFRASGLLFVCSSHVEYWEKYLYGPIKLTYFFCDPENFRIPCMALCSNFSVLSTLPSLLDLNTVKCHAKWPEYPCYRKCTDSLYDIV